MTEVFCTICARGGSRGVPSKNIRPLLEKPLIAHSVERALESGLFRCVAVSSDSDEILEAARAAGATHLIRRPDEMATDQAPKVPAIRHAMLEAEKMIGIQCDVLVDLDATSPLRQVDDIIGAYDLLNESGAQNVISVMPARRSPYFNIVERGTDGWASVSKQLDQPLFTRQSSPACYDINGSIYVWHRHTIMEAQSALMDRTALYVMPEERSIDIDTEFDFQMVEILARRQADKS